MTHTHRDTTFKVSEIIFSMGIFTIEVFRTAKIVKFSRIFQIFTKSQQSQLFDAFFLSTSTSKHPKRLLYPYREFISVQDSTTCFNEKLNRVKLSADIDSPEQIKTKLQKVFLKQNQYLQKIEIITWVSIVSLRTTKSTYQQNRQEQYWVVCAGRSSVGTNST